MGNKRLLTILGFLGLYLLSTGVSYAVFSYLVTPPEFGLETPLPPRKDGGFVIDPDAPKTQACPLNGVLYTKQEETIWQTRRPLGVMIENHQESRPQSGLGRADIVYEAVAEGGITRFLAIYYCDAAAYDVKLCPVRSARTYYLDWISEYDGLYAHVGGATCAADVAPRAQALCQIQKYGIYDIDQMGYSFPYFWRDYERLPHEVATEHTMCSTNQKLWEIGEQKGWEAKDEDGVAWDENFKSWVFKEDFALEERGEITSIKFNFWEGYGDYKVEWVYDKEANLYKRFNGGKEHKDLNSDEQLSAKMVAILLTKETGPVDDHLHLLYETLGSGDLLLFQDGEVTKGEWSKKDRVSRTIFFDEKGKEIKLNKGKIWLEIIPTYADVEY